MNDFIKQLSREDVLANLYIRTNKKFPHKHELEAYDVVMIDFYQYTGLFYYYKNAIRFEVTKEIMEHFLLTIDEMIWTVNANTGDDFVLLPEDDAGIYRLIDKNGDSVERILLNNTKIDTYLRTIDDGFGLEMYPAKYNQWYVVAIAIPGDDEYVEDYRSYIKSQCRNPIDMYYGIDSDGNIIEQEM
ncbi:hypothetical protein SAMN04487829_1981 [Pseudobutyrivibrio sp. NOR37]|uniref:Uncharacterized protein n=1 Tax=Pseudobutyrivibrio xylanivorans TaxID=185007 RepID=A0A6M0LIS2_PSEXY|nr:MULTISPECIES: hypothetical protein [Pseudobutyrivibrio]NEX02354.1 hypothetical protein [Pseudobutyrivibrio xylanivorans]SFR78442.1 hypothetical protein SAMN04487829_1981 [Pseudobutyrivibrio sp. NOR37]